MTNTGPAPACSASCRRRWRKAMNPAAVNVPANTENRSAPCALIAGIGLVDQVGQLAQLGVGELAPPAGHRLGAQCGPALGAVLAQPGVDRPPVQAEGGQAAADLGRRHARLDLLDRSQADRLQRLVVELAAVVRSHSPSVPARKTEIKLPAIFLVWQGCRSMDRSEPCSSSTAPSVERPH